MRLDALCCTFFVWDFQTGFSCFFGAVVARFSYEISCFWSSHNYFFLRLAGYFSGEISCFFAVMRFHALLTVMRCLCEILCILLRTRYPDEISCFLGPLQPLRMRFNAILAIVRCLDEISCFLVWWFDVRTVESRMMKDTGDLMYTMVYWRLRGFVCASWVVRWRGGMSVSWVVVCKSASALGDGRVCVEVVWLVSRDLNMLLWFKEVRGFGRWSHVCSLKNVGLLWAVKIFWSGFFRLLFLRVDYECNRPSFHVTVFQSASAFNGDLNQWDVATVTDMSYSKSIRIYWRIHAIMIGGLIKGVLVWGDDMMVEMVESWCWRMCDIACIPMAHCNNACGLWLTVILLCDVLTIFHGLWPLSLLLICRHGIHDI